MKEQRKNTNKQTQLQRFPIRISKPVESEIIQRDTLCEHAVGNCYPTQTQASVESQGHHNEESILS
jgi:hypothetical protein